MLEYFWDIIELFGWFTSSYVYIQVFTSVTAKLIAPWGTDIINWDPAPLDNTLHFNSGILPSLVCNIVFITFNGCTAVAEAVDVLILILF